MKQFEIVTMSKAKFDKLSPAKQRMTIAQDVLDRIEMKQIVANGGLTCEIDSPTEKPIKEQLKNIDFKCEACAKGALFLSFIGIVNHYDDTNPKKFAGINSDEMTLLSKIFLQEQLVMIEIAFEGCEFNYNRNVYLTAKVINKCKAYKYKFSNDHDRLIAICKNIIKNKGTFIP